MDASGQQAFIDRIRSVLGHSSKIRSGSSDLCAAKFSDETRAILERIKRRSADEKQRLLDRLTEMAMPINLTVNALKDEQSVAAAIVDLCQKKDPEWGEQKRIVTWKHPLIEKLNLTAALAPQKIPVYVTDLGNSATEPEPAQKAREHIRKQVIESYIGITSADFCMAETATLVMRTRPGQARSVSLVPAIHVAVIHLGQIIADLNELYTLLQWDSEAQIEGLTNCMTFISGPSKTADVEATMVHGAHGPREVHVYVILD